MSDQLISSVVTVFTAIIGLAIIAVLVSKNANTSGVVSSFAGGFAKDVSTAISPVTGVGIGGFNSLGTNQSSGYMYN